MKSLGHSQTNRHVSLANTNTETKHFQNEDQNFIAKLSQRKKKRKEKKLSKMAQ